MHASYTSVAFNWLLYLTLFSSRQRTILRVYLWFRSRVTIPKTKCIFFWKTAGCQILKTTTVVVDPFN